MSLVVRGKLQHPKSWQFHYVALELEITSISRELLKREALRLMYILINTNIPSELHQHVLHQQLLVKR